ncbi:yantar [Carabus blaptoides fortunei]
MSTLRKNNQKERPKNVFNVKVVGKKKKIELILGINCVVARNGAKSLRVTCTSPGARLPAERPSVTAADLEGKSPDEQEMMRMMGFCNFDTTKGKKVEGNDVGAVHVILKRKYRQYMNRKGGFNRPLDFVA